jgi:hypothetical protein
MKREVLFTYLLGAEPPEGLLMGLDGAGEGEDMGVGVGTTPPPSPDGASL